jgi:glycosyltransferase involved in cell wall biosynthesis
MSTVTNYYYNCNFYFGHNDNKKPTISVDDVKSVNIPKSDTLIKPTIMSTNSLASKSVVIDTDQINIERKPELFKTCKDITQSVIENHKFYSFFKWFHTRNKDLCIIISSTQIPGNGGSATNAYNMIKLLNLLGYNKVYGIFFENLTEKTISYASKFDDDGIGNIKILPRINTKNMAKYKLLIQNWISLDTPDLIFGRNYVAPNCLKQMFPKAHATYLVSGSRSISNYLLKNPMYFKNIKTEIITEQHKQENETFSIVDSISCNSILSHCQMVNNYKQFNHKFSDVLLTSNISGFLLKNKFAIANDLDEKRSYDITFAVSRMSRVIKGAKVALEIFKDERLKHLTKLLIGDEFESYISKEEAEEFNITCLPKISNCDLVGNWLKLTKVLIVPSYYEACPNIITESLARGCKVVTSENVGGYEYLDTNCIVKTPYDTDTWVNTILNVSNLDITNNTFYFETIFIQVGLRLYISWCQKYYKPFIFNPDECKQTNILYVPLDDSVEQLLSLTVIPKNMLFICSLYDLQIDNYKDCRNVKKLITIHLQKVFEIIPRNQIRINLSLPNKYNPSNFKNNIIDCFKQSYEKQTGIIILKNETFGKKLEFINDNNNDSSILWDEFLFSSGDII